MRDLKLTARLRAVSAYIPQGAAVADIGTDHGYIPAALALTGGARRIIAADLREGPLENARATAVNYGVEESISFVLTNGLTGLEESGIDTVVIAGMGGETIIGILEKADWIRVQGVTLVLQPQTKFRELVYWLGASGFTVLDAALVSDDGRIYEVLCVGIGRQDGRCDPLRILMDKHDVLLPTYLDRQLHKKKHVLEGLKQSAGTSDERLRTEEDALDALLCLKEETKQW